LSEHCDDIFNNNTNKTFAERRSAIVASESQAE